MSAADYIVMPDDAALRAIGEATWLREQHQAEVSEAHRLFARYDDLQKQVRQRFNTDQPNDTYNAMQAIIAAAVSLQQHMAHLVALEEMTKRLEQPGPPPHCPPPHCP